MLPDFMPFFEKYEAVAAGADEAFKRIRQSYSDEVVCEPGCTDCCYALFDFTLIEALYLNYHFNQKFTGTDRDYLLEKANAVDRKIYKLKRDAYKRTSGGASEEDVIEEMAKERIRCPLLNDSNLCDLYEYRPVACRVYGAPLGIGGRGRTCGKTGFQPGLQYTSINMDALHDHLMKLSAEFVQVIGSKHVKMSDMLVPVSMALLTDYNEEYLGVAGGDSEDES
ncbi:MAG: YkgJ family cysteine cluster protein [Thermodesulfobacteriota bacterium]